MRSQCVPVGREAHNADGRVGREPAGWREAAGSWEARSAVFRGGREPVGRRETAGSMREEFHHTVRGDLRGPEIEAAAWGGEVRGALPM